MLERSVVLDAASAGFLCSCITGSETPARRPSGGKRLSSSLDLLSWQAQKPGAGICRLEPNQLADHGPLRPLGNFDGGRCRPPVQVLPPAYRVKTGLEQSRADRSAGAGSGGNRLPWIPAHISAVFSETHRPAVRTYAGGDHRGSDICGGSRGQRRDHLAADELHRSNGMSLRQPPNQVRINRASCPCAFDLQSRSVPEFVAGDVGHLPRRLCSCKQPNAPMQEVSLRVSAARFATISALIPAELLTEVK